MLLAAALEQAWCREFWMGFCQDLLKEEGRVGKAPRILDRALTYFELIDQSFDGIESLSVASLHEAIASAQHRRHLLAYRYVLSRVEGGDVGDARQAAAEDRRLEAILARANGKDYEQILVRYVATLQGERLRPNTVRLYAGVAQAFCERAHVSSSRPFGQAAIHAFLQYTPGAANSLSRFATYCRKTLGWDITMPNKAQLGQGSAQAARSVERLRRVLATMGAKPAEELRLIEVARVIAAATGVTMRSLTSARAASVQADGSIAVGEAARIEPGHRLYPFARRWQELIETRHGLT